ncbi:hypothetical protein AVEN_169349-1 [Araneus ventricosus]|uniref:C2H2-type domain-containing protein n=1 Tax=Araneus ventricosus TaxID=182803 RepID=A0A4Y2T5I1_ARAVE|nr:hypothetical protein AVEN_169349-1 [Araneus ventricosus]
MSSLEFSDSEDIDWMNEVSTSMLMHGSEPGPSHAPLGFGYVESNETQSWSDTDVEWMNNVPMPMVIGEPSSSQAPSGFGLIEPTPSTSDHPMVIDEPGSSHAPTSSSLVIPSTSDYVCDVCKKTFSNKSNLKRHMKKHGDHVNHACSQCNMKFYRVDKLQEHMRTHTREKKKAYPCEQCDLMFPRMSDLLRHKRTDHSAPPAPRNAAAPRAQNSGRNALGVYSSHFMTPTPAGKWDLLLFLKEVRPQIHDMIVEELQEKRAIKWYCVSKIRFSRETSDGDVEYCTPYFRSKVVIELDTSMIGDHIEQAFDKIKESVDEFLKNGSGWVFDSVIHMELKTATYHPLAPSSYIPLPSKLAAKKALINIKNTDQKCFIWSVLAALHPAVGPHPERVYHYTSMEQELRLGNVTCPVQPCKVPIIEKLNNLRINVFGYEDEEMFPLYISKREDIQVINLLYITQGNDKHYCLIKNMSRLLGDLTKCKKEKYYCYSCLHRFTTESLLKDHLPY